MKFKILKFSAVCGILLLTACTHEKVQVVHSSDRNLTCNDIIAELAEVNHILKTIDDNTGISTRNATLGVLFWPGIIINQMNAGDARDAANSRLIVLTNLQYEKDCNQDG
tara:strand:- start:977 stop:1306 length:330 start_codon:yes stop_codon:yes gene_type:complete